MLIIIVVVIVVKNNNKVNNKPEQTTENSKIEEQIIDFNDLLKNSETEKVIEVELAQGQLRESTQIVVAQGEADSEEQSKSDVIDFSETLLSQSRGAENKESDDSQKQKDTDRSNNDGREEG